MYMYTNIWNKSLMFKALIDSPPLKRKAVKIERMLLHVYIQYENATFNF
jgi:hypothetical protein